MPGSRFSVQSEAQLMSGLHSFFHQVFDLVFPPRCVGCGRVDTVWCEHCIADLADVPLKMRTARLKGVDMATTGIHRGKLQQAVQALKYDDVIELAEPLGARLSAALNTLAWSPDIVIPIPLHRERLQERGYNQSYLLAEQVAAARGIPCLPDAARRERYTRPQVGLSRDERLLNVSNAFIADAAQCRNQKVLIVDDVLTTGATLSACASAVLAAGAAQVCGLTVTVARD